MAFFIPELWELSHVAQSREQNVNLQIMFQSNKPQQKKSYTSLLNEERKTASTAVAAKKKKSNFAFFIYKQTTKLTH